jgi:Leucine-rich repeat (LRR) protein
MSCVGNRIAELDLRQAKWPRLETLDLSDNDIAGVFALERLGSLVTLNLGKPSCTLYALKSRLTNARVRPPESNNLTELVVAEPNDVAEVDLSLFPRLRTLYADNNSLSGLDRSNPRTLSRLENLSLRNQRGRTLRLSYDDLRDVKRLYISGESRSSPYRHLAQAHKLRIETR